MGTPKLLVETWKNFLTEEEYTDEQLEKDPLWSDLYRGDIDGYFWNAGDGTLESYTNQIYDLADEMEFNITDESRFKYLRDRAMEHSSIGDAFRELVPKKEVPHSDALTDPGSGRAAQRQSDRKEKETGDLIDGVIDDIIQSLGAQYSSEEVLNKIHTRAKERKKNEKNKKEEI